MMVMVMETFLCLAREALFLAPSRLESSGVWRGSSKPNPRLGRPQGVLRDVGVVVLRGRGMGQHWAQEPFAVEWVKFGVGAF